MSRLAEHLVERIRAELNAHSNSALASKQAAYLRNHFSFMGISKPTLSVVLKPLWKEYPLIKESDLHQSLLLLWEQQEREFHYAALILGTRYKKLWSKDLLPVIEHLTITHSWWDTVDTLATHFVGELLLQYPHLIVHMDAWIIDENQWKRRVALLYQLKYKNNTDIQRLSDFCKLRMHEKEFFIAKAIGWSLREYSKTNPSWVSSFISMHKKNMAPLSVREASKYC
jgi:3-methyladenine DNA glycosylase AlkD